MQITKPEIQAVLQQNTEVLEEISSAANELGVLHAVLSTKVPAQGDGTDLQDAVDRVAVIEKRIDVAAGTLESSINRLRNSIVGGNTSNN